MQSLFDTRLKALRAEMLRQKIDLVALGPSSHMMWLTGVDPHGDERPVMALVSLDGVAFLMPELNEELSRRSTDWPFFVWADGDGPSTKLDEALESVITPRANLSIVLDETMRTDFSYLLTSKLEAPVLSFTTSTIASLRARKDTSELKALRKSAEINDAAVMAGFDALREGITELEIVEIVFAKMKDLGAKPGFCLVAFGPNAAMPHHHSNETTLAHDTPILIDAGCWWAGYPSDMTRMAFFGTPDGEFLQAFDAVEKAVTAALSAFRQGISGREMDGAARGSLTQAGHGPAFVHRLGHGMGLDIHEPPYLNWSSEAILGEHNVFSIEPGVYYPGKFGIRLEDIVQVDGGQLKILSKLDRSLVIRG